MLIETIGSPLLWGGFLAFVAAMLAIDLGVFHRESHEVTLKEAGAWSAVWVALALLFNAAVWAGFGPERGLEFTTGYLIEKALAIDNIFVFVVIFAAFQVPSSLQHRVLFWGVFGALVMRAAFSIQSSRPTGQVVKRTRFNDRMPSGDTEISFAEPRAGRFGSSNSASPTFAPMSEDQDPVPPLIHRSGSR